jgi:hypothetical protein
LRKMHIQTAECGSDAKVYSYWRRKVVVNNFL